MASQEPRPTRTETETESDRMRREFTRQVLEQALIFMRRDNDIIGNFASITDSLARYTDIHPERAWESGVRLSAAVPAAGGEGIAGGGPLDGLFDFMKEVIMKDKEFFLGLISKLL